MKNVNSTDNQNLPNSVDYQSEELTSRETRDEQKFVKQIPIRSTAIYYSEKQRSVHQICVTDRDYAILLDSRSDVIRFETSVTKSAYINNEAVDRKFAFQIETENDLILLDIVYKKSASLKEKNAINTRRLIAKANNCSYSRITRDSFKGNYLNNIKYIKSALLLDPPKSEFDLFRSQFKGNTTSLIDAQNHLISKDMDPDLIRQFIAHKLVECDLNRHWQDMTISWEAA